MSSKMQYRMKMALYAVVLLAALMLDEAVFGALKLRYKPCVMPMAVACIGLWEASLALWAAACGHGAVRSPCWGRGTLCL